MKPHYVITNTGRILVQVPDPDSRWGFHLADDDQTWDGGLGSGAQSWEVIPDDDPRITEDIRERLGWILEEATR